MQAKLVGIYFLLVMNTNLDYQTVRTDLVWIDYDHVYLLVGISMNSFSSSLEVVEEYFHLSRYIEFFL